MACLRDVGTGVVGSKGQSVVVEWNLPFLGEVCTFVVIVVVLGCYMPSLGNVGTSIVVVRHNVDLHVVVRFASLDNVSTPVVVVRHMSGCWYCSGVLCTQSGQHWHLHGCCWMWYLSGCWCCSGVLHTWSGQHWHLCGCCWTQCPLGCWCCSGVLHADRLVM